jgi:UDPglucose 6-dehydrogenase
MDAPAVLSVTVKLSVAGLWHLGSVTAACLASAGHDVTGFDPDVDVVRRLSDGQPPIFEPGLPELIAQSQREGRLRFSSDPREAMHESEVVWIAWDTPVDRDDRADVEAVMANAVGLFPHLAPGTLVLVSSQLPVGSVERLEQECARAGPGNNVTGITFGCVPENLRLGQAVDRFLTPDRVVVGVRHPEDRERVTTLFAPFTDNLVWMSVESAEMTKHALNAFLATSVAFANEIATLCERVGADASEVARGLRTDFRIGPKAYLAPGGAFAGGTLARDVVFLNTLGNECETPVTLLSAVYTSNELHRGWPARRLKQLFGDVRGRRIAVWGLTYKPDTDTLRGSHAVALCETLAAGGASVTAHDPAVAKLPAEITAQWHLSASALEAARDADAIVVATEWPEYRQIAADALIAHVGRPRVSVIDANRFLWDTLASDPRIQYVTVGSPA